MDKKRDYVLFSSEDEYTLEDKSSIKDLKNVENITYKKSRSKIVTIKPNVLPALKKK